MLPASFLLLATSCVPTAPAQRISASAPPFDAIAFFLGRTQGNGEVKALMSGSRRLTVEGDGRVEADGTLILDQLIEREGAQPERRQWRIREVAPGRYRGTLSTAEGAVIGWREGNGLHLRYRLKDGGFQVRQSVYLQPGGRTAVNWLTLRRFGMPVAAVQETIRKVD